MNVEASCASQLCLFLSRAALRLPPRRPVRAAPKVIFIATRGRTIRSHELSKESSNIINDLFTTAESRCAAQVTPSTGLAHYPTSNIAPEGRVFNDKMHLKMSRRKFLYAFNELNRHLNNLYSTSQICDRYVK